jgi:hypothetical protein
MIQISVCTFLAQTMHSWTPEPLLWRFFKHLANAMAFMGRTEQLPGTETTSGGSEGV